MISKILIIEDNLAAQMAAKMVLKRFNYNIHIAGSAEEAFDILKNNKYDIIFMDIGLPGMNGIDAARHIKNMMLSNLDTNIIALTANEDNACKEQCLNAGMIDFISKPLTYDKVVDLVKTIDIQPPK